MYTGPNVREVKWPCSCHNYQTLNNCCAKMVQNRNVLKAYIIFLRLSESENINIRVLSLVELITCHSWTMCQRKMCFCLDSFPKFDKLEYFLLQLQPVKLSLCHLIFSSFIFWLAQTQQFHVCFQKISIMIHSSTAVIQIYDTNKLTLLTCNFDPYVYASL